MSNTWQRVGCGECADGMFFYSMAPKYVEQSIPCWQDCIMPWLARASDKDVVQCVCCGNTLAVIQDIEIVSDPVLISVLDSIMGD